MSCHSINQSQNIFTALSQPIRSRERARCVKQDIIFVTETLQFDCVLRLYGNKNRSQIKPGINAESDPSYHCRVKKTGFSFNSAIFRGVDANPNSKSLAILYWNFLSVAIICYRFSTALFETRDVPTQSCTEHKISTQPCPLHVTAPTHHPRHVIARTQHGSQLWKIKYDIVTIIWQI